MNSGLHPPTRRTWSTIKATQIDRSTVTLSNAWPDALSIWIEPWCDELELPPRSNLTIQAEAAGGYDVTPATLEITDDGLVMWVTCPGTMTIRIDDVVQDTGSRTIELPRGMLDMPVKTFVDLVFGVHPLTRPGGTPAPRRASLWERLIRR